MGHDVHVGGHEAGSSIITALIPALALLLLAVTYLYAAHRASRRNPAQRWSRRRTLSFSCGLALLALALLQPVATWAHTDFRGHMVQHLLIGMYAPLALVLGAPATLLLRIVPATRARQLTGMLHTRSARLLTHPATAMLLSNGSLAVLYFTPLYNELSGHPVGHWSLHAHFLLSGCLFAHIMAGPDPSPKRPAVRVRLAYLGFAIAIHAVIAQMMYGGFWIDIHAPIAEVQGAAEVMYYGGDIAELLLAAALVASWRPERRLQRGADNPLTRTSGPMDHRSSLPG